MRILVQFPTRERPQKFFDVIYKYYTMADAVDNCLFHIVIDADDLTMNNTAVLTRLQGIHHCVYTVTNTSGKVKAINTMPKVANWQIVLLVSDDMIVQKKGWDSNIRTKMKQYYPDTDGVLWYDDGFVHDRLNTLVCMGKRYYDRFNYIYHPSYISLWCDNEFTEVARTLRKQTYIPECIIRHEHALYMNQPKDSLYNRNESLYGTDQKNYNLRKARGFR